MFSCQTKHKKRHVCRHFCSGVILSFCKNHKNIIFVFLKIFPFNLTIKKLHFIFIFIFIYCLSEDWLDFFFVPAIFLCICFHVFVPLVERSFSLYLFFPTEKCQLRKKVNSLLSSPPPLLPPSPRSLPTCARLESNPRFHSKD